ncbi:Coenzyme A biosynthesis bifunctional protein CoaBC [Candidatus Entotheonellaceae bacterium PAL068K]
MLRDKTVLLGSGGGPLTWVAIDVLRTLQRAGARVGVVLSMETDAFVPALTFQTLAGEEVMAASDVYGAVRGGRFQTLAAVVREVDALVVVPATPALLTKMATACADETLARAFLLHQGPTLVAFPGQATEYRHVLVQRNIQQLRDAGVHIYDVGVPETAAAADVLEWSLAPTDIATALGNCLHQTAALADKVLIITAGPTQEPIDPVRHISNRSSGKTGYVLAAAAQRRGAQVILVSGPTHLDAPTGVQCLHVQTALEMRQAVLDHFDQADAVIKTAAVADFRPLRRAEDKVKKDAAEINIPLERNPDILAELGRQKGQRVLVGFAAETQALLQNAQQKVQSKNLDLIVVNDVSDPSIGFASDHNRVHLLEADGRVEELPTMTKTRMAEHILDRVQRLFEARDQG